MKNLLKIGAFACVLSLTAASCSGCNQDGTAGDGDTVKTDSPTVVTADTVVKDTTPTDTTVKVNN